ncbi:serine/threonine-protein kinase [Novipirellula artificiosorum]|uniref:Serine/threonine-protein kinase Pkn1 n=1 Tax=Novipirellula artificiosorum TaxID=2528016 RepID=A0A5C6E218_9BACT|nr:serine/threonine-protein kinase [Novipirellula artificiosorum]TWU42898.1 Serine/threonine-protein kinase Pkn1 [Novipirellula artificiosorum]
MNTTQQAYDFLSPASQPDDLGMLGAYRIISELGKGGMGFVFRAEDTRLKRTVALKVMNKKIAATPNSRTRFIEEARAMAAVHHDNVVVIFEVGEKSGTPFMAMELLKGQTLEALNRSKELLPYGKILDFAKQITRGLAAAHAQGIVHRDIKPANIWIEQDTDRVKILDFGLALAQTPVDRLSGSGSVIGTPGYLSPEQARTDPLDDRSDLYSLGVVLYELCTGRLPLSSSTVSGQLVAILAHKPKPVRELNPNIPAPLANLIHRLLAKESRDRPTSARDLEQRLKTAEHDCEAESEVALAINKLQQGLIEVVSKKESEIFDVVPDVFPETVENPLAFPVSPLTLPASPVHSRPGQAGTKKAASAQTTEPNELLKYWPFFAIGACLLLIVPLVIFVLTTTRDARSTAQAPIIIQAPVEVAAQNVASESAADRQPTAPTDSGETLPTEQVTPDTASIEAPSTGDELPDGPAPEGLSQDEAAAVEPSPIDTASIDTASIDTASVDTASVEPSPADVAAGSPPEVSPERPSATDVMPPESGSMQAPAESLPSEPEQEPEATEPPTHLIRISTGEGDGADSTVSRTDMEEPLGKSRNIAVRRRNNADLAHAYLRFDLSNLGKSRNKIHSASLVLTLADVERPRDVLLELRGNTIPQAEKWKESGRLAIDWTHSFSRRGIEMLPMLEATSFTRDEIGKDKQLRIGGEGLAEFLRDSKTGTVTLILAGGLVDDDNWLNFISHEGGTDGAPALELEMATD